MKRSEKQIEASRRNGAKSRGPVTPQGRINAARPNFRQGMFAGLVVLDGESRERFNDFERIGLDAVKHPVSPLENPVLSDSRHDRQFERALKTFFSLREKLNPPNPQPLQNNDPQPNA